MSSREKMLFAVTAVVVAGLTWLDVSDRYTSQRTPRAQPLDEPLPAPTALVRYGSPLEVTRTDDRGVSTFSPPRELLPLDPLELPEPPIPAIDVRGPALVPSLMGVAARSERIPSRALGTLVVTDDDAVETSLDDDTALGGEDATTEDVSADELELDEAPLYEDRFDWIARFSTGRRVYGRLLNDDPHGLRRRIAEALVFQQVSVRSGRPLGAPYTVERDDVIEFELARTFENEAIYRSRDLGTGPGSGASRRTLALDLLDSHPEEPQALDFAAREAERALEVDPDSAPSYRLLATIRALQHDIEGELAVYAQAAERGVRSAVLLADHGARMLALGLNQRAEELLVRAEAIGRSPAEVSMLRGRLAEHDGRLDDAFALYRTAESSSFSEPRARERRRDVQRALGRIHLARGRLNEAQREAGRLLLDDPDDVGALLLQGAVDAAKGDIDAAATRFGAALAVDPNSSQALINAAIIAWRQRDGSGAQRLLERAIDVDPLSAARAHRTLGVVFEDLGEREAAREQYIEALRLEPGEPRALYRLGRLQRTEGDVEAAVGTLRTSLALGGPEPLLMAELGLASLARSKPDDARRYFREALRLEPDAPVFEWLLGLAALREGDLMSAVEPLASAANGRPGAHAALGVARYRQGDAATALDHFDEAAKVASGSHATFASTQAERIRTNQSKRQWLDRFRRTSLQRGWTQHQWEGSPRVWFVAGEVHIEGRVDSAREDELPGLSRVVEGGSFDTVGVEMSAREGRFGVSLTYRQVKGALGRLPKARLSVFVDEQGVVRARVLDQFDTIVLDGVELATLDAETVAAGVALGIRRVDRVTGTFEFLLGGRPIGEPVQVKSLRNFKNPLDLEIFAEAAPQRDVDATLTLSRVVQTP